VGQLHRSLAAAAQTDQLAGALRDPGRVLASAAGAGVAFLVVEAAGVLSVSHVAAAERSDQPTVPAPLGHAGAVRERAGTWLASQASPEAISACNPVMCSVPVGRGIPAADLLITVAAVAAAEPVRILRFADARPGSSWGAPPRTAGLVAPQLTAQAILAFVRAWRWPCLPARASLSHGPDGQWTLTIQFIAPASRPAGGLLRTG
jgi:hypothetical protein